MFARRSAPAFSGQLRKRHLSRHIMVLTSGHIQETSCQSCLGGWGVCGLACVTLSVQYDRCDNAMSGCRRVCFAALIVAPHRCRASVIPLPARRMVECANPAGKL